MESRANDRRWLVSIALLALCTFLLTGFLSGLLVQRPTPVQHISVTECRDETDDPDTATCPEPTPLPCITPQPVGGTSTTHHTYSTTTVYVPANTTCPTLDPAPNLLGANPRTVNPDSFTTSVVYDPGRTHVHEELLVIGEGREPFVLKLFIQRTEKSGSKVEQRVSAYLLQDGQWRTSSDAQTTKTYAVTPDSVVRTWNVTHSDTRLLEEALRAQVVVEGNTVRVQSDVLENELTIRSLPHYTKIISESDARVTIGGDTFNAHMLYTRLLSSDVDGTSLRDPNYYSEDNKVTTNWLAWWDTSGDFYFVDTTNVRSGTAQFYDSHEIGIQKRASDGAVRRTFDVSVQHNDMVRPTSSTFTFGWPINTTVQVGAGGPVHALTFVPFTSWLYVPLKNAHGNGFMQYIHNE